MAEASAESSRGEKIKITIEQHALPGSLWFAGWRSIGFLHLSFWRGVVAIVIWPLGAHFAR